ncbi:hypothetical protein AAG570_008445, partial [Ranatra chinensis]
LGAEFYPNRPNYPQPKDKPLPIPILRQSTDFNFDGNFNYDFETQNGINTRASGVLKNKGTKEEAQVMEGSYRYTAPDGTPIEATWVADEGGFRIQGVHLPTPPPIPEAIVRALAYIRSLPPAKLDQPV